MGRSYEGERKRLVERLKRHGYIKSREVEEAFLSVPRERFVPEENERFAYADTPLEIGYGQTISAPHMIAIMCEHLELRKGLKVLEVGAGSGYHAGIVARIVGREGHVYTIERIGELARMARENLKKVGIENVTVVEGDGSLGLPEFAPYDRIYVTCAAPSIPKPLEEQLKVDGIILIPVGRAFCTLIKGRKTKEGLETEEICGCAFVPLVGKYGFNEFSKSL